MSEFLSTAVKSYPHRQSCARDQCWDANLILQPYRNKSIECFTRNICRRRSCRASKKEKKPHIQLSKNYEEKKWQLGRGHGGENGCLDVSQPQPQGDGRFMCQSLVRPPG
jgi:hypothetical protein